MTLPVFGTTPQQDQRLYAQGRRERRQSDPCAEAHSDTICPELKEVDSNVSGVGWSLAVRGCGMVFCIEGGRAMFFASMHGDTVSTTSISQMEKQP